MKSENKKQRQSNSEENALFRRKENFSGYRFCPFCKASLNRELFNGATRLVCANLNCDFVFYHNPVPAAGALIIENSKLLLVKRAHEPKKDFWCLPSGFMEWTEHPAQTAVREVAEETGLQIELTALFNVYSGNDDPRTNAILILFLARVISGELAASDDASEVTYFPLDKIPDNIAFEAHRQAIADYRKTINRAS